MSHIYCQTKNTACSTPQTCQQTCQQTCKDLTTGNGGGTVFNGQLGQSRMYHPDYEIEHTHVNRDLTPLGWTAVVICAVVSFVIFVVRHA